MIRKWRVLSVLLAVFLNFPQRYNWGVWVTEIIHLRFSPQNQRFSPHADVDIIHSNGITSLSYPDFAQ